jgi:uncharacterized membrane protein YphA (DoxX/SURF4 family)
MRIRIPMHLIETAARVFLGAVFIYASWDKIRDPAAFAQIIGNYQILPPQWINPAALMLPWVELTCGLCLVSGRLVRGSALTVTLLIIIFMAAMTYGITRGIDTQCGCFSTDFAIPGNLYWDLFRDLILLCIAVAVLLRSSRASTARGDAASL